MRFLGSSHLGILGSYLDLPAVALSRLDFRRKEIRGGSNGLAECVFLPAREPQVPMPLPNSPVLDQQKRGGNRTRSRTRHWSAQTIARLPVRAFHLGAARNTSHSHLQSASGSAENGWRSPVSRCDELTRTGRNGCGFAYDFQSDSRLKITLGRCRITHMIAPQKAGT